MDAAKYVEEIDLFSNHKLKRKEDLKVLILISYQNNHEDLFDKIIFKAKYILGLQRVLKKGVSNPEIKNINEIKKDYTDNLIQAIELLKSLVKFSSEETTNHFQNLYFELSHQNMNNLNELFQDLEWVKIFFNREKRL
jgi:hypothetical protein